MAAHPSDPAELERLFARNVLSRRQFIAGLTALGVTAGGIEALVGSAPTVAHAAAPRARYLVLIVLDAFRPDYMQLAPMPVLSALARSGATYDRAWVGQIESLSPAGHASLSTGCMPKYTGVLGFEWRDPATRKEAMDGWPAAVLEGLLERDLRESGVDSIALAVKQSDRTAKVVAISSEKVYAADAIGGWAADYILYHRRDQQHGMLLPSAVPNHVPPASFLARPGLEQKLPLSHFTDWDYLSTALALAAIAEFRPRVLMVNLPGADVYGHPYGGPATPAVFNQVVAGVDRNIGRIVQAYKDAGIYDQTVFVVTADHGMVPNVRAVEGALTKAVTRRAGGDYLFHTGGTAAYIYQNNASGARAVAQAMAGVPGVVGAYYLIESGSKHYYDRAPGVRIDPALDAAHRSLLGTFVGPRAPDVVAPFRENTIGTKLSSAHGDHGGLNWGAQYVPLILSGPGIATGVVSHYPARLIDVAPTLLRLLGLAPRAMDGIILADALGAATAQEVAAQQSRWPSLLAHQTALLQQSANNIAEDARSHLVPPASLPLRP
jgi:predicted AlkP superfamily pyrophosphatase or phosphodiesterase